MNTKDEMIRICLNYPIPVDSDVVLERPYIPWIPENWNGLLVLGESQNLSKSSSEYVEQLRSWTEDKQVCRLYPSGQPGTLGVAPWDDGSLKLAVMAAFGEDPEKTAVSNAVPWSQVTKTDANLTPSPQLITASAELWTQMLNVLRPTSVIAAGNVAHKVVDLAMRRIESAFNPFKLRLPSKTAISRVSGMFNQEDLLRRYPEVAKALERHPEWIEEYALNKIYFACHAVSLFGTGTQTNHT